jgi:hypothetical protein
MFYGLNCRFSGFMYLGEFGKQTFCIGNHWPLKATINHKAKQAIGWTIRPGYANHERESRLKIPGEKLVPP